MLTACLIVVAAYLIGSVSFAVVVSKAFGLPDPHEYGSGNPGATNVLRTGNKAAALLTLVGDGIKGFVVVYGVRMLAPFVDTPDWIVPATAIVVFVGHLYPLYHHFAGGKGVATAAGIVFALNWPLALVLTVIWLTLALLAASHQHSSLACGQRARDRGLTDLHGRAQFFERPPRPYGELIIGDFR